MSDVLDGPAAEGGVAAPPVADLTGREVVVTGGASGIGAACARRLANAGARVVVVDLDLNGAASLAESIGGQAVQADLSRADFDAAALAGNADVLINNAGLQHVAPVAEFPLERFRTILAVMLEAPFRLIQAALPHMYAQGFGRIVNISSVHGLRAAGLFEPGADDGFAAGFDDSGADEHAEFAVVA